MRTVATSTSAKQYRVFSIVGLTIWNGLFCHDLAGTIPNAGILKWWNIKFISIDEKDKAISMDIETELYINFPSCWNATVQLVDKFQNRRIYNHSYSSVEWSMNYTKAKLLHGTNKPSQQPDHQNRLRLQWGHTRICLHPTLLWSLAADGSRRAASKYCHIHLNQQLNIDHKFIKGTKQMQEYRDPPPRRTSHYAEIGMKF